MKTIQQIIRELDGKDIENAYFGAYPKDIFRITQHTDLSVEEYKNNISEKFQGFLERLKDMDTEIKDGEQGILFAYKCLDDTVFSGIDVGLVYTDELLNESDISKVNTYAYEYEWQKHALKFLVADTKLTQDNLMEVIVSFLDTVSFFGYQQENLEREVQRLEEAINEVKEHSDRLITNTTEDLFEELGLPIEEEYPEENDKKSAYMKAVNDYTNYCKKIELERVKESLLRSGSINISACNSFTEDKL